MAKSGQKKAFVEETVRDDLPNKELTLSQRADIDMSSSIQAEAYRTGAFPNSAFWNDLSAISEDIHNTRRNAAIVNAHVDLQRQKSEDDLEAFKYEYVSKSNNDILLARRKMEFQAELQDLIERTKREGGSVSQAVGAFRDNYMKQFDTNIRLSGEFSPYAYDSLYNYVNTNADSAMKNAITWDYETTEIQNKAVMDTAASTALTYLYKGVDGNGNSFGSVEDGMAYMSKVIGPNLNHISERDEEELANTYYNNLVKMRAQREKDIYEADPINYPGGYQGFINNVQSLAAQYGPKRMWEFETGEEGEAGTKSFAVALTPTTLSALANMTAKTGSDKAVSQALAASSEYDRMIDYKAISAGRYTDSEFIKRNSVSDLYNLTVNNLRPLIQLAEQGNDKAVTEVERILPHYVDARSILFVKDAIVQGRAEGKDLSTIVGDLRTRFVDALRKAKDLRSSDGAGILAELIFDGKNGQTINMNLPEEGSDMFIDAYFVKKGGDPETARRNYVASLAESALNFIDNNSMADLLLMTNSNFSDGISDLNAATRIENIVRASDKEGRVEPNWSKLNETVGMLEHLNKVQSSDTQGTNSHTLVTEFIKGKAKELEEQPLNVRMATYEFAGRAISEAGLTDSFNSSNLMSLTNNEMDVAQNIAMWSFLYKNPVMRETYGNRIKTYLQDNETHAFPSIGEADRIADGLISGARGSDKSLSSTIDAFLGQMENLAPEDKPFLRYTMRNMAVATVTSVDKKGNYLKFNAEDYRIFLDSVLTETGVWKDSRALLNNNVTPQQADNMKVNVDKRIKRAYKALKIGDQAISTRVNSATGKLDITMEGQPATMFGEIGTGGLAGTGNIPMSYSLNNKPAGMAQGKYEQSVVIEASAGMMLLPLANARSNKQAMQYIERYAGKDADVNSISGMATAMFATAQRGDFQNDYMRARNANFVGEAFTPMPAGLWKTFEAMYDAADHATGKYERIREKLTSPLHPGEMKISSELPDVGNMVSKNNNLFGSLNAAIQQKLGLSNFSLPSGAASTRVIGRPISEVMSKDEYRQYLNYLYSRTYTKNKPITGTSSAAMYSAYPANFKAKPHEQKNLTYFADYIIPSIREVTGIKDITVTDRYRAGDPQHHGEGRAADVATDNLTQAQAIRVMSEILKASNLIHKLGTSDPELLRIYGHDGKGATKYNPLIQDLTKYDNDHGTNHKDHIHVTLKFDSETNKSGNFVRAASSTIQANVNGKVGYIDNRTSTFLPQALPNYNPEPWVVKRMGISQADIARNPMLRMTALATKYCWMRSAFGAGREDLAIAAVAGAKFKVRTGKRLPDSTVKAPTQSLTSEQVLRLMQSGTLTSDYEFYVDTSDKNYNYVKNVLRSAKKSNIISSVY